MSLNRSSSNYISCVTTESILWYIYHDRSILFGPADLSKMLHLGLCSELKKRISYPNMIISTTELQDDLLQYPLSDNIDADDLIEKLRDTLAKALLFIYVWFKNHPSYPESYSDVDFVNYKDFFTHVFNFILEMEEDESTRALASKLWRSVQSIEQYLGPYQGSLKRCFFQTEELVDAMSLFVYVTTLSQTMGL